MNKGSHHFLKDSKELREFLAVKGITFEHSEGSTNLYVHDLTSQQVFDLGIEYGNPEPKTDIVLKEIQVTSAQVKQVYSFPHVILAKVVNGNSTPLEIKEFILTELKLI